MTSILHPNSGNAGANTPELTLHDLLLVLRRYSVVIAVGSVLFALLAGGAALLLPKKYQASTLLAPVSSHSSAGGANRLGGLGASLGGLASLTGLSLGDGGERAETVATLQSEQLTRKFIVDNDLLPILFAKDWDASSKSWRDGKSHTIWEATAYFRRNISSVADNAKTGLVTMTISWSDAKVAAEWTNGLVRLVNTFLQEKAVAESRRNLSYLEEQLRKTTVVELRNSIYSLMEAEIKNQMLAQGNDSYALKVIDPASAPEKVSSPKPVLWVVFGLLFGLFVTLGFTLLKAAGRV